MVVNRKYIDPYINEWNESTKRLNEMYERTDKILAEFGIKRHSLTNESLNTKGE